jgi:hypothetical protein
MTEQRRDYAVLDDFMVNSSQGSADKHEFVSTGVHVLITSVPRRRNVQTAQPSTSIILFYAH